MAAIRYYVTAGWGCGQEDRDDGLRASDMVDVAVGALVPGRCNPAVMLWQGGDEGIEPPFTLCPGDDEKLPFEGACMRRGDVRLGEPVIVAGYPISHLLGNTLSVTLGNVSATSGVAGDPATFAFTAPIQPGNSGGPVLDEQGLVVGIAVGMLDRRVVASQNVNFAIKAAAIRKLLAHRMTERALHCDATSANRDEVIASRAVHGPGAVLGTPRQVQADERGPS